MLIRLDELQFGFCITIVLLESSVPQSPSILTPVVMHTWPTRLTGYILCI